MTEPEIIEGLHRNDQQVCRHLFDTYYSSVVFFVDKIINNTQEAEDIVIRAFNTFWNIREQFGSLTNIKAFLYITARNQSFNYLKHRKYQDKAHQHIAIITPTVQSGDTERRIIHAEFMKEVYAEIQALPVGCKQIFLMTYVDGLKANEIAAQLGITVSTVTTQRSRAIQLLRSRLPKQHLLFLFMLCQNVQ